MRHDGRLPPLNLYHLEIRIADQVRLSIMGRGMAVLGPVMAGGFGVLISKTPTLTAHMLSLTMQPSVQYPPT